MKNRITAAFLLAFSSSALSQVVTTQYGQVQGSMNGSTFQFLGIPYAKPPVINATDTLRWKAPQPHDNWTGTLNTTAFAPVCPQKAFQQGSSAYTLEGEEDCLYLNVWSPSLTGSRPVMVFIHGGGNQQGSASEVSGGTQMYFGKNMSSRGDVVVITIQYRLGMLGYLVHPGLEIENAQHTSGNYAVMDQIMALKWVRDNVANFGGDPDNVTIFGESAGGVNVGNLMLTPQAAGLFDRACIQSATPVIAEYNAAQNKGIDFADNFIAAGTPEQKIAHLRTLSSDSLLYFETSPIQGGSVQMNWQPVKDDVIFPLFPFDAIQSGNFNHVPLMIGSNADEMSLSAPQTVFPAMVTALINSIVPSANQAQATALYPPGSNTTEARASFVGILTDYQFTATTRRVAQCVSKNQEQPVWRYFFTHKHTIPQLAPYGSYHGMELFYVFNNWENTNGGTGVLFKPADDSVQVNMLSYWTNFAYSGNPNGNGLVAWTQYSASTDPYLEIKATPNGDQSGLRTDKCNLWDDVTNFVPCISTLGTAETQAESFSIYPNPSGGTIQLDLSSSQFSTTVVNTLGQLVLRSQNTYQLDISALTPGIYTVVVEAEGRKMNTKLVVSCQ